MTETKNITFNVRKAIAINGKALVVSLPKNFIDINEIKKGDALKVVEDGNTLIITKIS